MGRLERIDPWSAEYDEELDARSGSSRALGLAFTAIAIAIVLLILVLVAFTYFVWDNPLSNP